MLIALDYDGTFTEDPDLWLGFIHLAKAKGHSVIVATMRHESEADEVRHYLGDKVDRIICTGRKAKGQFLEAMRVSPDVWIDDQPMFIVSGAL